MKILQQNNKTSAMTEREDVTARSGYIVFKKMDTRWKDNDVYGHVNNTVYYSYFDTIVNWYLITKCGLDIHTASSVGYVVKSSCEYFSPISYPEMIEVGMRVSKIGNSSVTYVLAIFKERDEEASAIGEFVHVFVDRETSKSCEIPAEIRLALQGLI